MPKGYRLDILAAHADTLARQAREELKTQLARVRSAFVVIDFHLRTLEQRPEDPAREVRFVLSARFASHVLAILTLAERGMVFDGFTLARNATDTTIAYWLVCKDAASAALFKSERKPGPAELRQRLEALGVDLSELGGSYARKQGAPPKAPPARKPGDFDWDAELDASVFVRGGASVRAQRLLLDTMAPAILRFLKYDSDYVIGSSDGRTTITLAEGR
jgi:glycine cleavage system aminomethyltransferase T